MTTVMNSVIQGPTALAVEAIRDFYTEQVNSAVAAERDDIADELARAYEDELDALGLVRHAA
jgi:hypothetical protein